MSEPRYVIVRETDSGRRFLQHVGHTHVWTCDKSLAMEYTKIEVAQALAEVMHGKVEGL